MTNQSVIICLRCKDESRAIIHDLAILCHSEAIRHGFQQVDTPDGKRWICSHCAAGKRGRTQAEAGE